jgi:hypothetical protein
MQLMSHVSYLQHNIDDIPCMKNQYVQLQQSVLFVIQGAVNFETALI